MHDPAVLLAVAIQGMMVGSVYGLIAMGLTLVYGVSRIVNFAHADILVLAMYLCEVIKAGISLDPYISMFIMTPLMFIGGLILYYLFIRRLIKAQMLIAIQFTLGLVFVLEGSMSAIWGADVRSVPNFVSAKIISIGPIRILAPYIIALVGAMLASALLYFVLQYTRTGRAIRAIVQDTAAARLMGINVAAVQILVFALAIAILGFAAPLLTSVFAFTPQTGVRLAVFATMLAVAGGFGNTIGALLAGLAFGIAEALGTVLIPGELGNLLPYSIVILILLMKPQGLLKSL